MRVLIAARPMVVVVVIVRVKLHVVQGCRVEHVQRMRGTDAKNLSSVADELVQRHTNVFQAR